jgi:hypothetical protein
MVSPMQEIQVKMAMGLFLIGVLTFWIGVFLLVFKAAGKDMRALATQTTRLVQKGLAEDIAGLVGNASILLNAVNEMTRTTTGIGIFLTTIGLALMAAAIGLVIRLS